MEQHPVPQQISSYEFRLVGDMTLKQFGQVAAGVLVALLLYASPLPGLLKWPFIVLFGAGGFLVAFLPFEERPLHAWLIAFLRAIYSPTQYIWQRGGQKPEVFGEKAMPQAQQNAPDAPLSPDSQRLSEYLASLSEAQVISEQEESRFIERIQNLFSSVLPAQPAKTPLPPIGKLDEIKAPAAVEQVKAVPIQATSWQVPESHLQTPQPQTFPSYTPPLPTSPFQRVKREAQEARFMPQVPMPTIPTIPNVLVGMVSDQTGKIVEGAIIEIRDSQGNPVRAFRTNKLGQFRIVTPLTDDTYEVEVEKNGLQFDIIKVELTGEIVNPIEIKARGTNSPN